ncbi:MAG: hypothetical protein WC693_06825 [Patescibacteria group bacterium]|jgi:hypothetical protein
MEITPNPTTPDVRSGKLKALELPDAFKERLLALHAMAPDTGSNVPSYVENSENRQIEGYLEGLNETWASGYLALHPDAHEEEILRVVEEAKALFNELEDMINAA